MGANLAGAGAGAGRSGPATAIALLFCPPGKKLIIRTLPAPDGGLPGRCPPCSSLFFSCTPKLCPPRNSARPETLLALLFWAPRKRTRKDKNAKI